MRFKHFSLFLILLISACTFQVEVLNTPTPQPPTQAAIIPFSTSTPIASPDSSATLPPFPAFTATVAPLPMPVTPAEVSPIQFGPSGTYVDVIDSILPGKSKTYSIRAMKGQVMSVSFHQNEESELAYLSMRIIGADDSLLCASYCQFWRGVLPTTEDYYVTVIAGSGVLDFVMRVAINPPGAATQSFLYENKYRNASLTYTDEFAPARFPNAQVTRIDPELTLQFIDTQFFDGTNLGEVYFLFGSSTDSQVIASCTEPLSLGGPETISGETSINGVNFTKSQAVGVGAGNIYEQTYYRTVYHGTCYEITYFIHSTNIGNYEPGAVKEFDHTALIQKFDQILSTLVLE